MVLLSASSFCYFLINFAMQFINGSIISNTLSCQFAEVFADIVSNRIYQKLGAKYGFSICFMICILGSVLLLVFWQYEDFIFIFIIIAKFGISAAFNIFYMSIVQLIPTIFTVSVFGYCNVVARTITMMSSIFAAAGYPLFLYANILMASVACVTSLLLVKKYEVPK